MDKRMTTGRRTRLMAGTLAMFAGLVTLGGPIILAEHYAQTGAGGNASGYYAVEQTRQCACPETRNSRTASASSRGSVENS
jgi:hypothetical protein